MLKAEMQGYGRQEYRIGGSILHRGKDVASTYRLCPRSRTGVSLISD